MAEADSGGLAYISEDWSAFAINNLPGDLYLPLAIIYLPVHPAPTSSFSYLSFFLFQIHPHSYHPLSDKPYSEGITFSWSDMCLYQKSIYNLTTEDVHDKSSRTAVALNITGFSLRDIFASCSTTTLRLFLN